MSEAPTPEPQAEEESSKGDKTALVPLSFFGNKDVEPGKTCTVKVERVYEDQVEVSYVPHSEDDDGGAPDADDY